MKFNQEELGEELVETINMKDYPVEGEFVDGQIFDIGQNRIQVVHLPGHSAGHCGFYFPKQDILYSADIDLTDLGPWYGGASSDVDDFIASIKRIKNIQPSTIVSAHLGIVKDRISERIDQYLDHIYLKDERLLEALKTPQTLEDMVKDHLFMLRLREHRYMISLRKCGSQCILIGWSGWVLSKKDEGVILPHSSSSARD